MPKKAGRYYGNIILSRIPKAPDNFAITCLNITQIDLIKILTQPTAFFYKSFL